MPKLKHKTVNKKVKTKREHYRRQKAVKQCNSSEINVEANLNEEVYSGFYVIDCTDSDEVTVDQQQQSGEKRNKAQSLKNKDDDLRMTQDNVDCYTREKKLNQERNARKRKIEKMMKTDPSKIRKTKLEMDIQRKVQMSEYIATKRENENFQQAEKIQNKERMRIKRENSEFTESESRRNIQRMRTFRMDPQFTQAERGRDIQRMRFIRAEQRSKAIERRKNTKRIRNLRTDLEYVKEEQRRHIRQKQDIQDNPRNSHERRRYRGDENSVMDGGLLRNAERNRDRQARRIQRGNDIIRHRNLIYNQLKQHQKDASAKALINFVNARKQIPDLFCSCCERMFFANGLIKITRNKVIDRMSKHLKEDRNYTALRVDSQILNNFNKSRQNYLCYTCNKYVGSGRVPKLSSSNGLKLPPVPECLKELNDIEERVISPFVSMIKFITLDHRASNPQIGAQGSVIYIPTDVNEMEKSLPRSINNINVLAVPVEFKRNMGHSTSLLKGLVRMENIEKAGKYLQETYLYKKHGINFHFTEDTYDVNEEPVACHNNCVADIQPGDSITPEINADDEYFDILNEGDEECLLIDLNEIAAHNTVVVMAPGQYQKPVSPFSNPDIEFLCFPKIFAGEPRVLTDKNITLNDTIKWEIRYYQNRLEPRRILYLSKTKLLNESYNSIKNAIKKKKNTKNVTVQQVLQPGFMDEMLSLNNGLKFMSQIRCAPAYMQHKKKVLFAMVRQIGPPTFFLTVSAVETNWPELIQGLVKYTTGNKISLLDALNLPYEQRARLVNENPVFTSMYYDNKVKNLMQTICNTTGIFGAYAVTDTFERREFQQRGSPHEHILLWIPNAPKINPDDPCTFDQAVKFADQFITCEYDESNPFCKYLRHKHTPTCSKGKKNKNNCRFNFPKFVMPATMILEPLLKEQKTSEVKANLLKIKEMMLQFYTSKDRINKSFEDILEDLELSKEAYLIAIRSSINQSTIFYKRRSCEVDINTYNRTILNLMESNVDLQFVLDEYGVAAYIVGYVAKDEGGISKVLKDVQINIAKDVDRKYQDGLRCVTNKFLNAHIMSTSEAVFHSLGTPVTKFSRADIFINTAPKEDRVVYLKTVKELQLLDPDSTDIAAGKDVITHYSERRGLDNICLAEYAAYYFRTSKKATTDKNLDSDDEQIDADLNHIDEHNRRKKARILRYVRYKHEQDPDNFFREQLLLFLPWRNEDEEIESVNWSAKFAEHMELIKQNHDKLFTFSSDRLDDAIVAAEKHREMVEAEEVENFERNQISKDLEVDILVQVGIDRPKESVPFVYTAPPKTDKTNRLDMLSKLNERQLEIVMNIYKCFTTGKLPLHIFISGSAGVGKSMVISIIYQLITHHLEYSATALRDQHTDTIKVLLCAFSGKAAFLIGGNTLHSAFSLPLQENSKMSDLPMDVVNNLRQQLMDCRLIVIDEVSMVGSTIFSRIDTRLRQITGNNESFGGLSIITVGDFLQLPPVKDSIIFYPPKHSLLQTNLSPLWDEFYLYELTEVMRQKDDLSFVKALNSFARGGMTKEDINIIKTREVMENQVPDNAIRLYYTNADVDKYNNKKISESPSPEIECIAVDTITGKLKPEQKCKKLKMWKERATKDCGGYPYTIRFKQGIKYMVTANLDVSDGLVNGATGVLEFVYCSPKTDKPKIVFIKFDSRDIGRKIRQQYRIFMENNNIDLSLTPIPRKTYNLTTYFQKDYQMIRDQFPMVPCEALTIHKSQGQTYENVCIDFRKSANLTRQLVYVALSRVTKLSGLHILGTFPGNMKSNNTIAACLNEMDRLRTERQLQLVYDNLVNTDGLKIVYLNIRSLRINKKYVDADKWYSRCDILIFSETCLYDNEKVEFPGFTLIHRSDTVKYPAGVKKHIGKGIMCFSKIGLIFNVNKSCTEFKFDKNKNYYSHVDLVNLTVNDVTIVTGYKSPKANVLDFKDAISKIQVDDFKPTIVIGDFNFNLNDSLNAQVREFNSFMSSLTLTSVLLTNEATTVLGSRLDVLYTNIESVSAGIYESYFSDHKPVFCIIPNSSIMHSINRSCNMNDVVLQKNTSEVGSLDSETMLVYVEVSSDNGSINENDRNITSSSIQCSGFDPHIDNLQANNDLDLSQVEMNIARWVNEICVPNLRRGNKEMFENVRCIFTNNYYTFANQHELSTASTDFTIMRHKSSIDETKNYLKTLPANYYNSNRDKPLSTQHSELSTFQEIPISGDGNCMFNAISYALVGNETFSFDLRAIAFQTVIEKSDVFEQIKRSFVGLESGSMFNLLQICCTDKLYGNLDHLLALSFALERIIIVMQYHCGILRFIKIEPPMYASTALPILLHLTRPGASDAHYNVLLPLDGNAAYDFDFYDQYSLNQILMGI